MDRAELADARDRFPEIEPIWQERRQRLERERERIVTSLDTTPGDARARQTGRADTYRSLIRLDRSLSFLDRALLHLDDLDNRTRHAEPIPLDLHPERYR